VTIRSAVAIGVLAAMACFTEAAVAAPTPAAPPKKEAISPEAEALFIEGRKLFDERKFAEACDKLAESHQRSPSLKALGLLAGCHEEQGRTATAYREYLDAAERARTLGDPRESFARKRAETLKAELPVVHIEVTKPEPGLSITQNGKAVEGALEEIYVDPGPVEIVAQAPKKKAWRTQVTAAAKARVSVIIPELAPEVDPSALKTPAPRPASPPPGLPAMRVGGIVSGAVGVVALAVGSGLGVKAIQQTKASRKNDICNEENLCTDEGAELRNNARTSANLSTAFFAVGVAGVVAGAVLFFIPSGANKPRAATALPVRVSFSGGTDGAGVTVLGRF
jgi:hypothetical protein